MPDVEWSPDQAPDENFKHAGYMARLVAHYCHTLANEGLSEYIVGELGKEYIACSFIPTVED